MILEYTLLLSLGHTHTTNTYTNEKHNLNIERGGTEKRERGGE